MSLLGGSPPDPTPPTTPTPPQTWSNVIATLRTDLEAYQLEPIANLADRATHWLLSGTVDAYYCDIVLGPDQKVQARGILLRSQGLVAFQIGESGINATTWSLREVISTTLSTSGNPSSQKWPPASDLVLHIRFRGDEPLRFAAERPTKVRLLHGLVRALDNALRRRAAL